MAADVTIRALGALNGAQESAAVPTHALRARKAPDVAQKFESFVLQTFIQEMMPDSAEGVFGSGIAGDFWKSMLSEKIAEQVAERGSLGIANYIKIPTGSVMPGAAVASSAVTSHLTTLSEAVAAELDPTPVSGE